MRRPEGTAKCHGKPSCNRRTDDTGRNHAQRILGRKGNGSLCDKGQAHYIIDNTGLALLFRKLALKESGAQGNGNRRHHTACHDSGHDLKVALCQLCGSEHIRCLVKRTAHINGHHAA